MLDSGADRDVISETVIEELNIATKEMDMRVITVDNSTTNRRSLASFVVESVDGSFRAEVDGALVGRLLTGEGDVPPHRRDLSSFPHLRDVEFDKFDADVSMIICAAHADAWIPTDVRRGPATAPFAFKSDFGWTIAGRSGRRSSDVISVGALSTDDLRLQECFQRIFYHDFAVVSEEELGDSKENKDMIAQLMETIYFDEVVGKYFVGLPWRYPRETMTQILRTKNSRGMAMKRLRNMIPRMQRDPARRERVFREVKKFRETGAAIEIDSFDDDAYATLPRWYLPLHVDEKKFPKTRICHDARASTGGVC